MNAISTAVIAVGRQQPYLTCRKALCVIDTSLPADLAFDLDHLYSFLSRDPHPVLTFYGGEPLMRADLVTEILRDAPAEKFMLQTNGLLLHGPGPADISRFDTILVSIDGPELLTDNTGEWGPIGRSLKSCDL